MSSRRDLIAGFFILTFAVGTCQAQNALLLMRPGTADTGVCAAGTAEPKVIQFRNPKIKGQDEVRLAAELGSASMSTGIDESRFKRLKKSKIRDLSELESRDGLLYVATGEGRKILAIPDVAVPKNGRMTLGQYAEMTLEGETQEGKKWTKQVFPLKSVWRVFVLSAAMTPDEGLFRHAEQEKSIGQWAFYLTKVASYRVKEANEGLSQATTGCLDRALQRFRGGDFRAVKDAKEFAQMLVAMAGQDASAAQRLASIKKEEEDLHDRRRSGMQYRREQNWDEALAAFEPLVIYRNDPSMKEFGDAYSDTLTKSHDLHVDLAQKAGQDGASRVMTLEADSEAPFQEALKEYEIALKRKPDSVLAKSGRREMIIRIALVEAKRKRAAKQPGPAYELISRTLKEQGKDDRLATELKEAGCEFGSQLYEQARNLVAAPVTISSPKTAAASKSAAPKAGAPVATKKPSAPAKAVSSATPTQPPIIKVKVIQTPGEKPAFMEAREKLVMAMGLCAADEKSSLLTQVNTALAQFHVMQARESTQRKLFASALLHLKAAQWFQADRADLDGLIEQVRPLVQQRVRLQAGVVIKSANNECAEAAQQIRGALESGLTSGGANVQLVSHDQAEQLLRKIRSAIAGGTGENLVILSGQVGVCSISITGQPRSMQSKYQVRNQNWENLRLRIQDYDRRVDDCKRAAGANEEQACRGLRNERQGLRDQMSRESPVNMIPYSYQEQTIAVAGQMRVTLQLDDTISRGSRSAGEAVGALSDSCVDRQGVRDDDASGGVLRNNQCPRPERMAKLQEMTEQVRTQAEQGAAAAIRSVANGYLDLARKAPDQQVALEQYILFALLASDRSSPQYQQALAAIRGRDADLRPETALQ